VNLAVLSSAIREAFRGLRGREIQASAKTATKVEAPGKGMPAFVAVLFFGIGIRGFKAGFPRFFLDSKGEIP